MPEQDETDAITTSQTEQEAEQREDTPPPVRERWGQDPWEMRWGC